MFLNLQAGEILSGERDYTTPESQQLYHTFTHNQVQFNGLAELQRWRLQL